VRKHGKHACVVQFIFRDTINANDVVQRFYARVHLEHVRNAHTVLLGLDSRAQAQARIGGSSTKNGSMKAVMMRATKAKTFTATDTMRTPHLEVRHEGVEVGA